MKRKGRVKMRGSHTHGWGAKKKHRGKGSQGGKGRAGSMGNKILKFRKEGFHIGKRGFKSLAMKMGEKPKAINLRDLARLAKGNEIDVTSLGYSKVLGTGRLGHPLVVKAYSFSRQAEEKIAKAGGKAVKIK